MTDLQPLDSLYQLLNGPIESRGRFPVYPRQGRSRRLSSACRQWTGGNGHPSWATEEWAVAGTSAERAFSCEHAERANEAAPDQAVHRRTAESRPDERLALSCWSRVYTERPPLTFTRFTPYG